MNVFIGGTPTSGKSFLALQFAHNSKLDIGVLNIDDFREVFAEDDKLKKWVEIYDKKDEKEFWKTVSYREEAKILIKQSEAFFPKILELFKAAISQHDHVIIEGVSILPHLAKKHFDFPGFFLINDHYALILQRLKEHPRWGKTEELQRLEAKCFVKLDVRLIKEEAEKYGYKVFNNPDDAEKELGNIFRKVEE